MATLLLVLLATGPVPTGGEGAVLRTNFAQVTVLGSWRPNAEQVALGGHGAPSGVCTAILVEPLPRVGGGYIGGETKDALLDGKSYQALTRAQLGRTFPPRTVTAPAASFEFPRGRPSYVAESPRGPLPVVVVATCLWGAPLPARGSGQMTFEVGYYGTVEPVKVTFDLGSLPTTPAVRGLRRRPASTDGGQAASSSGR